MGWVLCRFYQGESIAFPFGTGIAYSTFTEKWSGIEVSSVYEAPVAVEPANTIRATLSVTTLQQAVGVHDAAPHLAPTVAQLKCVVKNTGNRTSAHVVIATGAPPKSSRLTSDAPLKSVIGFERVLLAPHESTTVTFNVTALHFAIHSTSGPLAIDTGRWDFELLPQQGTAAAASLRVQVV
jgi:hypothetical protein